MNEKLNIVVIQGTTRKLRESIKVAKYIFNILNSNVEIDVVFVDPADLNLPFDGNDPDVQDPKYSEITKNADGFFIVTPEYNHSFPGSLKRVLDSELENYIHKPVAFAGVSSGPWGGVRAVEALVGTVREMGLVATFNSVYFPSVENLFNEDGTIKDKSYDARVIKAINELLWMAKVLKHGRENVEKQLNY